MNLRFVLVPLLMASLVPCSIADEQSILEPSLFGPWIVKAPSSAGWKIKRKSDDGVVWERVDGLTAYFNGFRLRKQPNNAAFLKEVKSYIETALPNPNSTLVSATYKLSNDRPYPCVRSNVVMSVTFEVNGVRTEPTNIYQRVFVCHTYEEPETGVTIAFSYVARAPAEQHEAEAEAFIEGVTLQDSKKRRMAK